MNSFCLYVPLKLFLEIDFKSTFTTPIISLRSWFYIGLHALPSVPHLPLMSGPMVFFFTRLVLGSINAFTQLWLFESIQVVFGANISQLWLWLTAATHGNFIAATAFIPSSTCMYLANIWLGFWLRKRYNWATYTVGCFFGHFVSTFRLMNRFE